jgi:Putative Ig domain
MRRIVIRGFLAAAAVMLIAPTTALGAVSISRAELNSGQLRVEGRGAVANATVTATSPESSASSRADGSGNFRIEAGSFRSSTCRVTVSDGPSSATATLSGCTTTSPTPTPTPTPTPSPSPTPSTCTINPREPAEYNEGDLQTFFWTTTGCQTSNQPVQFSLVAGRIPPGMTGPHTQGVGSGFVTGRPTTQGIFDFTIRARDQTGATDTEAFRITVLPPRPVTITTQGFSDGRVGAFYCCGNLFSSGGTAPYTYRITAGALPPGLRIGTFSNGTRVTGTPTTAGTFQFTLVSTDSRGAQSAPRTFTLNVLPA